MLLSPGTRLGPYEIVGTLGAGGMGEVYRARDARLQRDVAIKILPFDFAADPDRRGRFEREARVLAGLNDPRIGGIYGIEEDPATHALALVLELVDGPTVQQRLAAGPLPLDEAVQAAAQLAGALEAAHDRGVIHRDLKPANLKLTPSGGIKVLDFGLAKTLDADALTAADPQVSPTMTNRATDVGVILGTAAYMAPEQARGRTVDRRADIWAFGAVFYEMLTGMRAFGGDTISDTLASVLKSDPDWTRLPRQTPAAVRHLLRRCLDRNPQTRLQSIGEARITLTDPAAGEPTIDPSMPVRRAPWMRYASIAAVAAAMGALIVWALQPAAGKAPPTVRKLDLGVDAFDTNLDCVPALSPDGQRLVYCSAGRLFVRSLDTREPRELPETQGATYPFWSPDSRDVGYARDARIWRTPTDRGQPVPVGTGPKDMAGSAQILWTTGGQLIIAGSDVVGLFAIPATGGEGKEILALDKNTESDFHELGELPSARGVLFTVHRLGHGADTIDVFAGGARRTVLQLPGVALRAPIYAAPGYILFQRETTSPGIWGIRFSLDTLTTDGAPFMVMPGGTRPSIGSDGTLAFIHPSDLPPQLTWRSRDGTIEPIGDASAPIDRSPLLQSFRLSRDGHRIALALGGNRLELWVYDLDRHTLAPLSENAGLVHEPVWSADDRRVFFAAFGRGRVWNIHAIGARETREGDTITNAADVFTWPSDISRDGWLIYGEGAPPNGVLRVMKLDSPEGARPAPAPVIRGAQVRFAPDGQWIAYTALEGSRPEVYVRRFPFDQDRFPVSTGGGSQPVWAADGHELYFRSGIRLMAVSVKRTPTGLEISPPSTVFTVPIDSQFHDTFDVAPDGRFLMVRSVGRDHIGIILNWAAELPALQAGK